MSCSSLSSHNTQAVCSVVNKLQAATTVCDAIADSDDPICYLALGWHWRAPNKNCHQPLRLSDSKVLSVILSCLKCSCRICIEMPQNLQIAHTFFPWIPQVFLCCDLLSAEFVQLWHITKELTSVPKKNEAGAVSRLFA
jgi:hypothetical protein